MPKVSKETKVVADGKESIVPAKLRKDLKAFPRLGDKDKSFQLAQQLMRLFIGRCFRRFGPHLRNKTRERKINI